MNIIFNSHYQDYDQWYQTKMGALADKLETEAALTLLHPQKGQSILDVGCGTGNISLKLSQLGAQVTGVDISDKMLGIAKEKAKAASAPIVFEQMDCYHLRFPNNSFDRVISLAMFEFIDEPEKAYEHMMRVLTPGGVLVIGTIQRGSSWQQLYASQAFSGSVFAHAGFKSKEEIIALDEKRFDAFSECLYIPPGLPDDEYTLENELKYSKKVKTGGFVCVSFRKNL